MKGNEAFGRRGRGRRFSDDRAGAAEIIGDILLVAMSVIMVSALALQLSTVQDPQDSVRADLVASYDGDNITVLHMGGEALQNHSTRFQLFVNDSYDRHAWISDGKAGTSWRVGENWTLGYSTNPTQRVKIQVIDTMNNLVLLDQVLQRGPDASMVPDLGLTRNDILLLFLGAPFNDTNGPMANDWILVNVTIHNYGPAAAYNFTVRISDYSTLDRRSYPVLTTTLDLNGTSSCNLSTLYHIPAGSWGMHTLSVRVVPLPNETRFANNYASVDWRVGYTVIASHPGNPVLRIRSIESLPRFPVHGAYVNLTARISNQGGVPANATVRYYLGSVNPANLIGEDLGLGVPVGGESVSTIVWRTPRGGTHDVIVNVTDAVSGSTDQALLQVEVLPTILLVDDDRAGDGGLRDVTTSMKEALSSVAASFTVHTVVGGGDGPMYDVGERPLVDYDLVIWLTGYEAGTTVTAGDQVQLARYLDEGGKLWLIGQDVVSGLGRTNAFLNTYMKVDPATPLGWLNAGLTDEIEGHGPLEGFNVTMNLPFPTGLTDRSDTMRVLATGAAVFNESGGGNPYAILFNATTNGTPTEDTYKTCLFGYEPSRIRSPNERSIMTYEMLEWFGVGAAWGRDLGVSDQRFSKTTPAFMEVVNVTMYLRNNGIGDEPVDQSRPQLQVGFYVDGVVFDPVSVTIEAGGGNTTFDPPTSEIWIPQDTGNASLKVPGRGGYIKITMGWVADQIGEHTMLGRVDPYDYIQELNENNNVVAASLSRTLFVRYGTLVVDDDGSPNNGGANYDSTVNITRAFDVLGYTFDQVNTTGLGDGPDIAKMELYNAIIWVTGQAGNALTATDKTNLEAFLDKGDGRYLWLVGPRAIPNGDYTDGSDEFVRDYLRVARVDNPVGQRTPDYLEGANLDPVAHGTRYPATPTYADSAHQLVPYNDGYGMLYQSPMPGISTPNEIVYSDGKDGTTTGWYARITQPLTTSTVSNVHDPLRGQNVIQVARTGSHVQDNFFIVGDFSLVSDQNPDSLPWKEEDRFIAQWSFRSAISYTFIWHLTDTTGSKHTLTYTDSDTSNLGLEPVHHGLGAYTADDYWHTVTRDLLRDLREGAGAGLNIREVDGFEVAINTGTARVDDITLSRPFIAVRHDNVTANFRTVVFGWDQSFISYTGNEDYNAEIAYLVMSWFNMYDERTEMRITHLDLFHTTLEPLRDMKPMMGESYMLKAKVWNPGGTRGDAVVRFSDGSTVIDSVSISVEHDSFVLIEVIWTPLFAGDRTMSVSVDPDDLLEEVFEFNNDARMTIQVYFFYDDMESGPAKWTHSSTIARLNGESTLEYLDPGPVASDVLGEWSEYNGWRNTTDNASLVNITKQYHSQGTAFYMHEPIATSRTPVDVILTLDATGSMEWDTPARAEGAKSAMFTFVNRMHSSDRGAVAAFTTYYPFNSAPNPPLTPYYTRLYTPLTSDKSLLADGIVNISIDGGTPFWNAVVVSYNYIRDYGDATRVRCIVVLTDGDSNSDRPTIAAARAAAFAIVKTEPIPVFLIGYGSGITAAIETSMINLAAEANITPGGGGWYYYSPGPSDIAQVFENISKKIEELAQTLGRGEDPAPVTLPEPSPEPSGVSPRVVLFSDNMEFGTGGWTTRNYAAAGTSWRYTTNDYRGSGIHAWRCYDGGNNYHNWNDDWLITPTFDALGYRDLQLSFWHRPAMRRSGGFDAGFVFLSNDDGATWLGIQCFASNIQGSSGANPASVTGVLLNALTPTSTMKLAFRMWTDDSSTAQGWSVDDVVVTGTLGWGRSEEGAAAPQATVTILSEGFELEPPPGWSIINAAPFDSYWHRDSTYSHTDSYGYRCCRGSGDYRKNDDDWLLSPTFDLSGGYTSPLLTFWHRTDVFEDDWCYAYISNDDGATWTLVWQSDTNNNTWAAVLGLDMTVSGTVALTDQMKLGFRFVSNNDNDVDRGWSVDDVLITAVTPPPGPPPQSYISYWNDGDEVPRDKYITTPTFSLTGVSSAKLTFWHKYNLKVGSNGGVLQVGTAPGPGGPWTYRYLTPTQPYPNNLKISEWGGAHLMDDAGADMRWCWNGISGAGKFTWDYVQADLSPYIGQQHVRVRFLYLFCGGGTGFGWAIDDVEIRVQRSDSVAVTSAATDQWELVEEGLMYGDDYADGRFAVSGTHAWWNHNPRGGIDTLKGGIDNSLVTIPIDLSRAKDARLNALLRFNILYPEGRPPDGFRVEVSGDNGISWRQINMGVRSAWNVSGTEPAGPDGTSYTGVNEGDNWVSSGSLTRLNCDLSGWAGSVIQIRFRVITRNDTVNHHQDLGAGFGGFFIDDVTVTGNTTTGQGRSASAAPLAPGAGRSCEGGPSAEGGRGAPVTDDGARVPPEPAGPDRSEAAADATARILPAERRARPGDSWLPTE